LPAWPKLGPRVRGDERLGNPDPIAHHVLLPRHVGPDLRALGLALGFLTPIAAFASILLNLLYFVLMISDWAEQGQNLMMVLAAVVVLGTHAWDTWSIDHVLHLFGA